jgi:hypothetical protein
MRVTALPVGRPDRVDPGRLWPLGSDHPGHYPVSNPGMGDDGHCPARYEQASRTTLKEKPAGWRDDVSFLVSFHEHRRCHGPLYIDGRASGCRPSPPRRIVGTTSGRPSIRARPARRSTLDIRVLATAETVSPEGSPAAGDRPRARARQRLPLDQTR